MVWVKLFKLVDRGVCQRRLNPYKRVVDAREYRVVHPKKKLNVCLNARSIINKKNELNIMVDDIKPHIIGITESWANNNITDAELGLEGYVMFRKDIIGRRGGGVLLYIKETIPAYEVHLKEGADCNEVIWGHSSVT